MRIIKSQSHRASGGLGGGGERDASERRGDRRERWTSSRLLPDGQGSDCCSVSGPLVFRAGKSVCVFMCVRTGSISNDR